MKYGCFVVIIGFVGGVGLFVIVILFILCGVNFLGIDSVMCLYDDCICVWEWIVKDLLMDEFYDMI